MAEQRLLLDTHVWLWLVQRDSTLKPPAVAAIDEAAAGGGVLISAMSVWEVAMLEAKGRISLSTPCESWVTKALSLPGVGLVPLSPAIAVASSRLPGAFHGDPADRILVATARERRAVLVTRDERILAYSAEGHVHTLPA